MTTYTYDGVGQLTKESESNGTTLAYTYDRNGNRTKLTATGSEYYTVVYTYDAANRLTKETRTEGSTVTWTDYTYDSNGNVLTKRNKSGMGVVRSEGNEYNGYNQLVTQTVNEEGVITDLAYEYYPNGIRSVKAVDGVPTVYVANNGYVVAEYYETTLTAVYLWGANLIKSGIGSKTNYYLYNAHGDVVQLTNTTGAVVRNYTYDAFGVEDDPDDFDTNPFRYCGEYYDRESKTYYLRARYYDPTLGRFTQQDTHWNTTNMIYGDDPQKINEREDKLELTVYTMVPQITTVMQGDNPDACCGNSSLAYAVYELVELYGA